MALLCVCFRRSLSMKRAGAATSPSWKEGVEIEIGRFGSACAQAFAQRFYRALLRKVKIRDSG
jgi:hypothetical protein